MCRGGISHIIHRTILGVDMIVAEALSKLLTGNGCRYTEIFELEYGEFLEITITFD